MQRFTGSSLVLMKIESRMCLAEASLSCQCELRSAISNIDYSTVCMGINPGC